VARGRAQHSPRPRPAMRRSRLLTGAPPHTDEPRSSGCGAPSIRCIRTTHENRRVRQKMRR
jgi:hypothetical protein